MPDARKTLEVLRSEWQNCTKCSLGERRVNVNGQFVFGEGTATRGVLFIGEGPGKTEEETGRPFVGVSGEILRTVIQKLGLSDYYITNIVSCRSCSAMLDQATNLPMMRKNFKTKVMEPIWKDEAPLPMQAEACRPRLQEEIYLIDPTVIVSLGGIAAKELTGEAITITTDRGKTKHITIPGATHRPILTQKKGQWVRKVHGELIHPTEPNEVRYLLIPTLHPAYVGKKLSDKGPSSPFRQFFQDVKKAVQIHERYLQEVFGVTQTGSAEISDEAVDECQTDFERHHEEGG